MPTPPNETIELRAQQLDRTPPTTGNTPISFLPYVVKEVTSHRRNRFNNIVIPERC
jgi:hypothetical protein